jgi:translation initiation factor IF-2
MLDELQFRSVARDLPHDEPQHEDNLLVEAVSLLVQRQRETEAWVAEQIDQADQRTASVERRYADLDARLAALEEQLDRALRELEPTDRSAGERLARLREQVADLRTDPVDGRQLRPLHSAAPAPAARVAPPVAAPVPAPAPAPAPAAQPPRPAGGMSSAIGGTARERFGLLAMFLGLVAILYAVLSQLRF